MADVRLKRSVRVTFLGLAVNTALAVGKLVAGLLGNSHALVADAVESLADLFSSLVVWRGLIVAAAPADDEHPYGHGKAEPIAAALVATVLLFAAVGITLQSIREILQPGAGPAPFTLLVLLSVVATKEILFRIVLREAKRAESSALLADAWHHRSDMITSMAAAIGISIALIGGRNYASADSIAAIVAAGIIAWNGWRLLRPALDELMDTAPTPALVEKIRAAAETIPDVDRVEKCIVRKAGYHYFVDMHLEVDPAMSVQRAHDIAHRAKDAVRAEFPSVRDVLVHVEPRRGEL